MANTPNTNLEIKKAASSIVEDFYYYNEEPTEVKTFGQFFTLDIDVPYITPYAVDQYENYMMAKIEKLYVDYFGERNGQDVCSVHYFNARKDLLKAVRLKDVKSRIAYMKAFVKTMSSTNIQAQLRRAIYTNVFNRYLAEISEDDAVTVFLEYVYYED